MSSMHYRKYDFSYNVSSERGWQDHQQRERDHKEDAETDFQCAHSGRGYDSYSHSAQKRSKACATKPASIYAEKKSSYRAKLARQQSAECICRICCYAVDEGVIEITEEFHLTSMCLPPLDWRRTASGRTRPFVEHIRLPGQKSSGRRHRPETTQSRRWTNNCEVKIGLSYEWVTGPIGTFSVRHKSVINPFDLLDLMGIESQIPMFGYQQEPLRSSQENATEIPLIEAE